VKKSDPRLMEGPAGKSHGREARGDWHTKGKQVTVPAHESVAKSGAIDAHKDKEATAQKQNAGQQT